MMNQNTNFLMESTLASLDPALSRQFKDCVLSLMLMLDNYAVNFPDFTDHSMRHVLNVLEFCNKIVGYENIEKLCAEELFILLMGIYLHDVGMAISDKDFEELMPKVDPRIDPASLSDAEKMKIIRKNHNELSAQLIMRYAAFFELDDPAITHAVAQVARGHRTVDLMDEREYPVRFQLASGVEICLPYLAALVRLADEVDVGKDRNPEDTYARMDEYSEVDAYHFSRHLAIQSTRTEEDAFVFMVRGSDDLLESFAGDFAEIQATLDECRRAVNGRTKFHISQERIVVERVD